MNHWLGLLFYTTWRRNMIVMVRRSHFVTHTPDIRQITKAHPLFHSGSIIELQATVNASWSVIDDIITGLTWCLFHRRRYSEKAVALKALVCFGWYQASWEELAVVDVVIASQEGYIVEIANMRTNCDSELHSRFSICRCCLIRRSVVTW